MTSSSAGNTFGRFSARHPGKPVISQNARAHRPPCRQYSAMTDAPAPCWTALPCRRGKSARFNWRYSAASLVHWVCGIALRIMRRIGAPAFLSDMSRSPSRSRTQSIGLGGAPRTFRSACARVCRAMSSLPRRSAASLDSQKSRHSCAEIRLSTATACSRSKVSMFSPRKLPDPSTSPAPNHAAQSGPVEPR